METKKSDGIVGLIFTCAALCLGVAVLAPIIKGVSANEQELERLELQNEQLQRQLEMEQLQRQTLEQAIDKFRNY